MTPGADRMAVDLGDGAVDGYRLLTSVVIPRPIAWISSRSSAGIDNLAPHSFFTVASAHPPIVQFTSVGTKDTLRNILATGDFIVHIITRALLDAANESSAPCPPEVSEFDWAGIERESADVVAASRVSASPVALECRYAGHTAVGDCTIVFGRVLHASIHRSMLDERGRVDPRLLDPVARLGGEQWSTLGDVITRHRPTADSVAERDAGR